MGFFSDSEVIAKPPEPTVARCGDCGLFKKCLSPKMPVTGEGRRKVLIVAEAPGADEDKKGIQLIGKAGKKLRDEMDELGWDLDEDCWKTNAVICRPPDNKMDARYVEACRPNLNRTIEELQPETIVLLGGSAVRSFMFRDWPSKIGTLERWIGWRIPHRELNCWVCPTWHPSYLNRMNNPVIDLWFRKHLKNALQTTGRPHKKVSRLEDRVDVVLSPTEAAGCIRSEMQRLSCPLAFDYETNMLKPEHSDAKIYSCSICFGKRTIAYPWEGEAIKATREALRSPVPKVGANIKFEQRWTKSVFGHGVRNWHMDTMQCAHALDNRPDITSVKFQAYVRLGIPPWNEHIEPLLRAKGGYTKNKIDQIALQDLLLYNGLDSLIEYRLAEVQEKELKKLC